MRCPKKYKDRIAAQMDAAVLQRRSKGKQELKPYQCHRCKGWHLENSK